MAVRKPWLALAATLALSACMANPPVAVRPGAPADAGTPVTGVHTVSRGENLYRIALEHGLDFRAIAQWNGIAEPYVIHPGQRLRLTPPAGATTIRRASAPTPAPPARHPSGRQPPLNAPQPIPRPSIGQPLPPPTPLPAPGTRSATAPSPAALPAAAPPSAGRWQWPVQGRTVRAYSSAHGGNKGVDLAAARGAPVWATADGTVVYVGDGLKQYGNLVIIKHGEEYLSAYGHLDAPLVAEGAPVRKGQPIARVGGPAGAGLLHFEIRRRGEPVDPAGLLGRMN